MVKPKPTPPKDEERYFEATTVLQLIEVLKRLPEDARVYGTDDGEVAVWRGQRHLAHIDLRGI